MIYNVRTEGVLINQIFREHCAGFRIDPTLKWRVTPSFALYKLEKRPQEQIGKLAAIRADIEQDIHAYRYRNGLIGDTERTFVRVNLQPLAIEVNLPKPSPLNYKDVRRVDVPHAALCGIHYGIKQDAPLLWNPADSSQPHVLVAGTTGSGKTTLVQSLVLSMCATTPANELQFQFVDYKNSQSLRWLAKLPHVASMVTEPDDALHSLQQFYAEILHRKRHGADGLPRMILMVDELASFTDSYDKSYRDKTTHLLHEIARLGREYKCHMIACTQKPTAKVIGEQLKANLPVRLVGMVTSPEESKCATGIAQAGAHLLPGKGAFIYVNAGQVQRFQSPWIDDLGKEIREIRAYRRGEVAPVLHHLAPAAPPLHHPAPVQEIALAHTSEKPSLQNALVRTSARFPLTDKRPLTASEAADVRTMAEVMSKNELCCRVYGSKSSRYMEWINAALVAKTEPMTPAIKPLAFRPTKLDLKTM